MWQLLDCKWKSVLFVVEVSTLRFCGFILSQSDQRSAGPGPGVGSSLWFRLMTFHTTSHFLLLLCYKGNNKSSVFFILEGGYGRDGFCELTVPALKYVLSLSGSSVIWCRLNTTEPFTPSWHLVKWDGLESAAFIHKLIWDLIKVVECFT